VVSRKIYGSIETRKYRGEELVSAAAAPDFRTAMIHAAITGLEKDEPAGKELSPDGGIAVGNADDEAFRASMRRRRDSETVSTSIVQPGCTKLEPCRRRTSGGQWRRN
jgi:hypothetical protein